MGSEKREESETVDGGSVVDSHPLPSSTHPCTRLRTPKSADTGYMGLFEKTLWDLRSQKGRPMGSGPGRRASGFVREDILVLS